MNLRRISLVNWVWAGIALFLLLNLPRLIATPIAPGVDSLGIHDGPIIITEFMANPGENPESLELDGMQFEPVRDENGRIYPWIELHNRSNRTIDLAGWSLTDDPERPDKWQFDHLLLTPGEFLVILASGNDRTVTTDEANGQRWIHTNFRLSSEGGYLALHPPNSRRYLDGSIFHYPPLPENVSFGVLENARGRVTQVELFFDHPTPGSANAEESAWAQVIDTVEISHAAGYYEQPIRVRLTSEDRLGTIRYTTDGSVPTAENGVDYTGPIPIESTTPLRATVVRAGFAPGPVSTRTYLFLADIVRQDDQPPGFPATWGLHDSSLGGYEAGTPRVAIYAMDQGIVEHPEFGPMVREGLTSIPTISIVMPLEHFDIYADTHGRGHEFERPISLEYILPPQASEMSRADGFQIDAGLRIHGGAGRWSFMPKHSFRLYFRGEYGSSRLREPVFSDSPATEFNRLILRAGSDRSFVGHPPAPDHKIDDHRLATYTRDEWARASQIALSGYGAHGTFVHLYLNGVYWGLYNLTERLDTAHAATYLGGDEDDWFSVTQGGMRSGMPDRFLVMLDLAQAGGLSDPQRYATFLEFIDPVQFSDYVILQWYMGNYDWPENNWTVSVRNPAGRNLFFVWDAEDTWHDGAFVHLGGDGHPDAPFPNVIRMVFEALWENPDFRLLFADRLHAGLFNGGPLSDAVSMARWIEINAPIETAIAAESARWGYVRYDETITPADWRNARDLVLEQMDGNSESVLRQAREAGYYPLLDPPVFNRHGGEFATSQEISLDAATGEIWYTLDGADPRDAATDEPAATALLYDYASASFAVETSTVVRARVWMRDGETPGWSAEASAFFRRTDQSGDVRISEIMYQPLDGGDFEFVEIVNRGELPVDLSGAFFEGIRFRFDDYRQIGPGERMVIARDFPSYRSRYPEAPIHGIYDGRLSNRGETLTLRARNGEILDSVAFGVDERWPQTASGAGDSLVRHDFDGDPNRPQSWRASAVIHGSPGAEDGVIVAGERGG